REQIAVAASGNRLAAARDTRLDARTVAVRRAATGDRRLDARAARRVARSSVTRCAGTADRRLVAVSGGRVARRHGARVRRDAHLLARLARMGGEVARGDRAQAGCRTVGVLVAASGYRPSRTLPARRAGIRARADLLVVAGSACVRDVLTP